MMLIMLYCLSQNPDFPESVRPLMGQLKNSEQMLKFLNDLSQFSELFSSFRGKGTPPPPSQPPGQTKKSGDAEKTKKAENAESEKKTDDATDFSRAEKKRGEAGAEEKKSPPSPIGGIADKYIEDCLERYFKRR